MSKLQLPNVTLLGIDCVNVERLQIAMDISEKNIEFGATKLLTSLPTGDKRLVKIPPIDSIEDFSKFCITDLYKYVDTDYVLLVQYDGFVLDTDSWTDEFLKYDYIGAPWLVADWSVRDFNFPESLLNTWVVGNGGFCLRSKKFLEITARLADEGKITKLHPEDCSLCVWNRNLLEKEGLLFAPPNLAMKFSMESDYGLPDVYDKPFGFHGLFNKNIDTLLTVRPDFPLHFFLSRRRGKLLEKITEIFQNVATEGHLFGSVAEGRADNFSDVDIWLTFKDTDFKALTEKRIELYSKIGDIVHVCEPHQNVPINGIFSSVLYKTKVGLIFADYYLCPETSSFVTKESKQLFGNSNLPLGQTSLNPQKVAVSDEYRIDFIICFVFNSIKKLARKNTQPLDALFREYNFLREKYGIQIKELQNTEQTFGNLLQIAENIKDIGNDRQKRAIIEIENFAKLIEKNQH